MLNTGPQPVIPPTLLAATQVDDAYTHIPTL